MRTLRVKPIRDRRPNPERLVRERERREDLAAIERRETAVHNRILDLVRYGLIAQSDRSVARKVVLDPRKSVLVRRDTAHDTQVPVRFSPVGKGNVAETDRVLRMLSVHVDRIASSAVTVHGTVETVNLAAQQERYSASITDQAYRGGEVLVSAWPRTEHIWYGENEATLIRAHAALRMFGPEVKPRVYRAFGWERAFSW